MRARASGRAAPARRASGRRITLVWPPTVDGTEPRPSLNLAYLAAALLRADPSLEVSCVDTNLVLGIENVITVPLAEARRHMERTMAIVEGTGPDVLAVGAWTSNLPFALELVRSFGARHPDVPVVVGGYPATESPARLIALLPEADVLVRGEGERTLPELVGHLVRGERWGDVPGLSFRAGDFMVHTNPAAPVDLDELPDPDYDRFVGARPGRTVSAATSRGCPFSCSYCSNERMYRAVRRSSPGRAVGELEMLRERWGVERVEFCDNLFTADPRWVRRFCGLLDERRLGLAWSCSSRVDTLSPALLERMRRSGLESVYLGLESAVPESLRFLAKTASPSTYLRRARRLVASASALGVGSSVGAIVGLPCEGLGDMARTVSFLEGLVTAHAPHVKPNLFSLIAFPGSPLWDAVGRGEHALVPVLEPGFSIWNGGLFRELYWGDPWVVPGAFSLANPRVGEAELERFVVEARARLQALSPSGFYRRG